jgi:hypothetical protein
MATITGMGAAIHLMYGYVSNMGNSKKLCERLNIPEMVARWESNWDYYLDQ